MTAKELRQIPQLHRQIERDMEQLVYLQEKATSIPSTVTERERVQTSPSGGGNRYVEAAIDLERDIRRKRDLLEELQTEAARFIHLMPFETETERLTVRVMRYRYLKCYTWEEIADLLGYQARYIQRLEFEALKVDITGHGSSLI